MDPANVSTQEEFGVCLQALRRRRGHSLADLEKAAGRLPPRRGFAVALAKSTASDMCAGKTIPSDETLRTFLAVCDVSQAEVPLWLAAAARARTADAERPRGARRVRDSDPRSLGVHAAIEVPGAVGVLPRYVPRDIDDQLRALLRGGAGFVLLIGSSSVGKSRSAYEALLAELPDWWLFHPSDVAHLCEFAVAPTRRTIVWLDDVEHYISDGLTASTIRALHGARHPVSIVGALWPDTYHVYRTPPSSGIHADPFARQRELLNLATVLVVSPILSPAERDRALDAAATDPRLAATVSSSYGMTQALAAAPELIYRWEAAPDRHSWALITAGSDARRVGVRSPLPADLLRAAVPGYLTPTERAKAPVNWFEAALGYATTQLHGAAAALEPVAVEMGTPTGYLIADYVYQHALGARRTEVPPDTAWAAYAEYLADAADRLAAGDAAKDRMLYRHAEHLYRSVGPIGLVYLADLRRHTGRMDEAEEFWRAAVAETGDPVSRIWLAGRLARRGRRDEAEQVLRDAVAAGVDEGHSRLGSQLQEWGRLDEAEQVLRDGVAVHDPGAWFGLARVLESTGRLDQAEQVLRDAAATGRFDTDAGEGGGPRHWLTVLLRDQGRHDDADQVCRDAMEARVPNSWYWLATHLREEDRLDEAEHVWRAGVLAGERADRYQLSWLLLGQDRADEALDLWRDAIAAGHPEGNQGMAAVLEEIGGIDEAERALREAVTAGEPLAYHALATYLDRQDRSIEAEQVWRESARAGEHFNELALLLRKLDRADEAHRVERYGLNPDGSSAIPQSAD